MCNGSAPELDAPTSFIGRWMDILRPGFDRVKHVGTRNQQIAALERESVVISLENITTFAFVQSALDDGSLTLHGAWHDIATGGLEVYDAGTGIFQPV